MPGIQDIERERSAAASLLRLARMKSGLTQQALATRAGLPRSMISAYERDLRQPSVESLLRVLRAAGLELRMHLEPYVWADDGRAVNTSGRAKVASGCEDQWERWHGVASSESVV